MIKEYNHKHIQTVCPECKNREILQDPMHQETYCTHCGLILHDNYTIIQITTVIRQEENRNKWLNRFWKKTNKKHPNLIKRGLYKQP